MSPLTKKGTKVKKAMIEHYGEEKGTEVFYKSERSGKIKGVKKGGKRGKG